MERGTMDGGDLGDIRDHQAGPVRILNDNGA